MGNKKRRNIQHDSSARHARDREKQQLFFARYGTGPQPMREARVKAPIRALMAFAKDDASTTWAAWEDKMTQVWIIDGEWSEYHSHVARQDGWMLSHVKGIWEIVTTSTEKFATDNDARAHVLAHEHDPDNSLYMLAINAIIMGNMGKKGDG